MIGGEEKEAIPKQKHVLKVRVECNCSAGERETCGNNRLAQWDGACARQHITLPGVPDSGLPASFLNLPTPGARNYIELKFQQFDEL